MTLKEQNAGAWKRLRNSIEISMLNASGFRDERERGL
jgi:hypothetical protein